MRKSWFAAAFVLLIVFGAVIDRPNRLTPVQPSKSPQEQRNAVIPDMAPPEKTRNEKTVKKLFVPRIRTEQSQPTEAEKLLALHESEKKVAVGGMCAQVPNVLSGANV